LNRKLQFTVILFSVLLVGMLLLGASTKKQSSPEETYRHIGVFTEVLSKIKSDYVEEPDMKNVTLGALNGLLESLDPYASYLGPDQYKQYQKIAAGAKADVGLILAKRFGYIAIVGAIPGSPADKAGLGTGDMLETINNVNTRDMPLAYAEIMLKGEAGTTIEFSVLRFTRPEPQKVTLTRAPVVLPAVSSKMLPENIGYLQVQSLAGNRLTDVEAAVKALEKQGAKRLILDLRNCATGDVAQGAALANLFEGQAILTYIEGQKQTRKNVEAVATKVVTKLPLTVVTNRGTAGAAEVAAAALLETKRGPVVGERTYGDAAVRKTILMDDGAAVILSVAKYYSPSGKAIQDTGVTPLVPVIDQQTAPTGDEDEDAPKGEPKKPAEDEILKKAIEVAVKGVPPETAAASKGEAGATGLGPLNIPQPK
jgi:carboxyl-terminal processing protease